MMAKVFKLPSREARDLIDSHIRAFARGEEHRNVMFLAVAPLLKQYGIRHMPLGEYQVAYIGDLGDLPIIHISGRGGPHEKCPVCSAPCRAPHARYLQTERFLMGPYDIVTVTCLDCGTVYRSRGWKRGASEVPRDAG